MIFLGTSGSSWTNLANPTNISTLLMQCFFGKYLYEKNIRHWFLPCRSIHYQRILQSDWTRAHLVAKLCDKKTLFSLEFNKSLILNYFCSSLRPTKSTPRMSRHVWVWLGTPGHTQLAAIFLSFQRYWWSTNSIILLNESTSWSVTWNTCIRLMRKKS